METDRLIRRLSTLKSLDLSDLEQEIDDLIDELNDETKTIVAPELQDAIEPSPTIVELFSQITHLRARFDRLHDQVMGDTIHPSIADRVGQLEAADKSKAGMIVTIQKRMDQAGEHG